jgi:ubiquinol-cytochrome c reductase cytochrome c1 subunit
MKRILHTVMGVCQATTLIVALGFGLSANASEGGFPLETAPNRVSNNASLQNGAKIFVNYCLNCHAAASMRYNR